MILTTWKVRYVHPCVRSSIFMTLKFEFVFFFNEFYINFHKLGWLYLCENFSHAQMAGVLCIHAYFDKIFDNLQSSLQILSSLFISTTQSTLSFRFIQLSEPLIIKVKRSVPTTLTKHFKANPLHRLWTICCMREGNCLQSLYFQNIQSNGGH